MNWEETLKEYGVEWAKFVRVFNELLEQYEKTLTHPNFDEESIYSVRERDIARLSNDSRVFPGSADSSRLIFNSFVDYSPHFYTFYEEIADGASFTSGYFKKFIAEHANVKETPNNQFTNRGQLISEDGYYYELQAAVRTFTAGFILAFKNAAEKRSMGFLEDNAKIFGVDVDITYSNKGKPRIVSFSHDGLNFSMRSQTLLIHFPNLPERAKIQVCVYNRQNLPIGDYFSQLLGLVVAKPNELDVVGFAIDLAKIIQDVEMDFYFQKHRTLEIGIFTPFDSDNNENQDFGFLMDLLKEQGTYRGRPQLGDTRGYALQQILDSLEKHFGSYMGWFK